LGNVKESVPDTQNSPAVSVILPVYNRADLIGRAIRSVLRQTRPDFELIVIDDASTDDTEKAVRQFQDPRIRYIRRERNHLDEYNETGVPDNPRNDGLKVAQGRYIAYLDSDDIWRTDFLSEMTAFMDKNPDVDFAYCDAIWHRNLDGCGETANCNMSVDFGPGVIRLRNIIRTLCVMHKRGIVDTIGYFQPIAKKCPHEGVPYVGPEDWDYWFRISQQFTVRHHPMVLAHKINKTSDHYHDPDFDPEFLDTPENPPCHDAWDVLQRIHIVDDYLQTTAQLKNIEGWLNPIDGYVLQQIAAFGPETGEIVEIGSFMGLSTCWLALGSKKANREKVTAVDHFKGSPEHQQGARGECRVLVDEGTTFNRFLENIRCAGVEDWVTPVVSDSVGAASGWNRPIRFLFIDGIHSYEGSKNDFEAWSPFVVQHGLIGFHDIGTWPGVTYFFNDLMQETQDYKLVLSVGCIRIIQKI
jgi:hypothetical protein